jgi:hypothetical protein
MTMTPLRWLIAAFWVFVGGMLFWQAYNHQAEAEKVAAAQPQHFFFDSSRPDSAPDASAALSGPVADVRQTSYTITNDPVARNFTVHLVLTNKGKARAVSIQAKIQPFKGAKVMRGRGGDNSGIPLVLPENHPTYQINQWIEAPDLAPNESCNLSATFMSQSFISPGPNNAQIVFQTEKANP